MNQLTHFHENLYELSDVRDHPNVNLCYQRGGKGKLWGMDVYALLFCILPVLYVGSGLETG